MITDASVLTFALLVVLLVSPEMGEVGVFGISLKRRVESAEREAERSAKKAEQLEVQLALHSVRLDSVAQSVASAAAQATVGPILIGDAAIRQSLSEFGEKARAFESGESRPGTDGAEVAERPDYERIGRLIDNWERIAAALDLPPRRVLRDGTSFSGVPQLSAEEASRFRAIFDEELQVIRAARNTVAHARPLEAEELALAVDLSDRLFELLARAGG
ncbi:hypothetical protein [Actinotalea solisilvae]|uniref:hypothetical protein n=1 Tax=Actinotalea solisilvae TaxID=2072922 RepID=UPI0018F13148|nr:hypothetical protein [Actinotalea solisilvae]